MQTELPWISFEKAVAAIQAQFDPASSVTHNERLIDRLGHSRQFDVVVRGVFAGQSMLGVIECKDLNRPVGNPGVEAFITKAQDVNANFKIIISKTGFSKPALEKCAHYGIQPLSLIHEGGPFLVGTKWTADVFRWGEVNVTLHFVSPPKGLVTFRPNKLRIDGKSVVDWYVNYLSCHEADINEPGWTQEILVTFDSHQNVEITSGEFYLCSAISFKAERVCEKLERLVGIRGSGFYDWNSRIANFPPGTNIKTESVTTDFSQWNKRAENQGFSSGFIQLHIIVNELRSDFIESAAALDLL